MFLGNTINPLFNLKHVRAEYFCHYSLSRSRIFLDYVRKTMCVNYDFCLNFSKDLINELSISRGLNFPSFSWFYFCWKESKSLLRCWSCERSQFPNAFLGNSQGKYCGKKNRRTQQKFPFPSAFQFLNSSCSNEFQSCLMKICDLLFTAWAQLRETDREQPKQAEDRWHKQKHQVSSRFSGVSDTLLSIMWGRQLACQTGDHKILCNTKPGTVQTIAVFCLHLVTHSKVLHFRL